MMQFADKKILVSVITPTLNSRRFLERNILSIKNQDYPFIEHIVIDGGSTDNTLDILRKYEKTYNLKWISEKDNNNADAINKGFKMAAGDIVCWLDSDDEYLPGTIKKVVEVFRKNPEVGAVFGNLLLIDQDDKVIGRVKRVDSDIDIETVIYLGTNLSPQSTFWRKSVQEKVGLLNTKYIYRIDYEFFVRMAILGPKFYFIKDFLALNRDHSGQLTKNLAGMEKERKEVFETYIDKNIKPVALRWKKIKIYTRRVLQFIKQGDTGYILHRATEHMKIFYAIKKINKNR